jgi:hypothetical protein
LIADGASKGGDTGGGDTETDGGGASLPASVSR